MKTVKLKLSELKTPERNVRIHSEKQINEFIRSLEMFKQIRPIVVDDNYTILCGNGLYAALKKMGAKEADCLVMSGISEAEKKKLMLTDNKIYSLGVDDIGVFEEFLAELGDDLDIPGYDAELLETLTADDDDLDEMMSGYGIVTEEAKESMQQAAENIRKKDEEAAETAEEIKPAKPSEAPAEQPEPLERKYIICPKCGERIWI